jgi:hypothetical protein
MAIQHALVDGVIHTTLIGRVTIDDLVSYYALPFFQQHEGPWRELVDGRQITDMAITADGQKRLEAFAAGSAERLRGGRVAMVAASDVTYGMFRMWELQREGLGYEVRVFRELETARAWVGRPGGATRAGA